MMDVMIDIETLSTRQNALILTIAAIKFKRDTIANPISGMDTFYIRINKESCEKINMHIDQTTVEWWNKQSKSAIYEAFENTDRVNIKEGLMELSKFIKNSNCIWANSPNFDCAILESAYAACKLEVPWKFWILRDCRTIYDIGKVRLIDFTNENEGHNSLYDSYNQIRCLKAACKNLKIWL